MPDDGTKKSGFQKLVERAKRLHIFLDRTSYAKLKDLSVEEGTTVTNLIRMAIAEKYGCLPETREESFRTWGHYTRGGKKIRDRYYRVKSKKKEDLNHGNSTTDGLLRLRADSHNG